MLPFANTNGQWRDFLSCFFMSVSATCVTGLAVVDVGKDFSLFGQSVILLLMQIGGLSYMTITTLFVYILGRKLSYSDTKIFDMSNSSDRRIDFRDFVIKIGLYTLTIEFFGFLALLYHSLKIGDTTFQGIFAAAFHAVSAFCNAGLSLYSSSLEPYREYHWYIFIFGLLPILGGLGYTVLHEIWLAIKHKTKGYLTKRPHLSLHTKIALKMTGVMLVLGLIIQFSLLYLHGDEYGFNLPWHENFWIAYFQSVCSRSAGFNSIPINTLDDPSQFFLIAWMFIGACPGGTGGGIKVTTLAVIFVMMKAGLHEQCQARIDNRSLPDIVQKRAVIIFMSTILFIAVSTFLIVVLEYGRGDSRFVYKLFEVTSAYSTVGMSDGITGELSSMSQLVLCFCMLIGRPGTLLLLMSIFPDTKAKNLNYPEESILIG